MLEDILNNHRGPYVFMVTRPFATKPGFHRSEWLKGEVDREDVGTEALALLTDKRDTITLVCVWSVREQAFITSIRGEHDVVGTEFASKQPRRKRGHNGHSAVDNKKADAATATDVADSGAAADGRPDWVVGEVG